MSELVFSEELFGAKCPPANFLDPCEDEELIGAFPTLILSPMSQRGRREFLSRSILLGERIRYRELMRHLVASAKNATFAPTLAAATRVDIEREIGWRALHEYFAEAYGLTPETYERDMMWFIESIRAARRTMDYLVQTFFPMRLRMSLGMCSEVGAAYDPVQLLYLCGSPGIDSISRIRRFEAVRQLTLALLEFEMRLSGRAPEQLDADRIRIVRTLKERFFEPNRSSQVVVIAELDPKDDYRVSSFRLVSRDDLEAHMISTRTRILIPLDLRSIRVGEQEIPVFFDSRSKENISIKLILKRRRSPWSITDMNGFSLVFFNEIDLASGVRQLRRNIVRIPGMVSSDRSNEKRDGAVDPRNRFSSSQFKATKYDVRMYGWITEMQFLSLPNWANNLFAGGLVNRRLYKLFGNLESVFPVLFPQVLYHLDCRDPDLRQMLWDYQRAQI